MVLAASGLLMFSGFPTLFSARKSIAAQRLACAIFLLGSLIGWCGVITGLCSGAPSAFSFAWGLPLGRFSVGLDALSSVFLAPIFTIPALGSVYGLRYWRQTEHPKNGRGLTLFYGLLAGALALIVVARDSILFLMAWELMALAAFFLVSTKHENQEVRHAGWIYLIATHTGTLCLLALFALLRQVSGSFAIAPLPAITPGLSSALFLLTLAGFGMKAGIMPLHFWLPGAHANAPSHVSAVMSGVLLKMGLYGILRMLMILPVSGLWTGILLLTLGGISGILGIALASGQNDLKRLLAYSSIENIGIMVMGIGLALMGRTLHRMDLIVLGLGGALLHMVNHSLFKSMLFLNSGAIIHAVHTRDLNRMGGLAKSMPHTAGLFLLGATAICGLPPLNGFISEWLLYLGLFQSMDTLHGLPAFLSGGGVVALALIGALALACFVKVYGTVFLGQPRETRESAPHDAPLAMRIPMGILAAGCVAIGLFPWIAATVIHRIIQSWDTAGLLQSSCLQDTLTPLATVSWMGGALAGFGFLGTFVLFSRIRRSKAARPITWSCGYARPSVRMQYSATSLVQMITGLLRIILAPRIQEPEIRTVFAEPSRFESHVGEPVLDRKILPAARLVQQLFRRARPLQQGLVNQYLLYIALTVLALLIWILPLKTLFTKIFAP
jgi:hydrogenase-4 component B